MNSNKSYSRLDRLFILLENGSTMTTRKAAAAQLGKVQKKHPHELNNLLARLMTFVQHKDWDARVAGSEAIKVVISEVPPWSPSPQESSTVIGHEKKSGNKLKLSQIDINQIMSGAQLLLGSSGMQFESTEDEEVDARERVNRARHRLEKKLGLTVGRGTSLGVSSNDLFGDEDLVSYKSEEKTNLISNELTPSKPEPKRSCLDVVAQMSGNMSNRERNRAKQKAKRLLKQNSRDASEENGSQPPNKRKKTEKSDKQSQDENMFIKNVPKHDPSPELWQEWPFEWICEELFNLLFNPVWEWRHGACLALRDILNVHGSGAGMYKGTTAADMEASHYAWLEDAAIRMLCVMILDRFGDFVSDQVVAPVRESCAQALGMLTKSMKTTTAIEILNVLLRLTEVEEWEVRHAGFLGIKYILAVREDLHGNNASLCIPSLITGLCDRDGDVKSVSAEALLPVAKHLVKKNAFHAYLQRLVQVLCDSLNDLDDLTASTQSVLSLLSNLVATMSLDDVMSFMDMQSTIARLWAFTRHSIPIVRQAALLTLDNLLNSLKDQSKIPWFDTLANDGLWNLFLCCILEESIYEKELAVKVWNKFVEKSPQLILCNLCQQYFSTWMLMTAQPDNVPYSSELLSLTESRMSNNEEDKSGALNYICGNPNAHKGDGYDGNMTREESVTHTREQASTMLGVLCGYACVTGDHPLIDQTLHVVIQHLMNTVHSRSAIQRIVGSMVLSSWWKSQTCSPPPLLFSAVLHTLTEDLYFNELSSLFFQVQSEIKSIFPVATKQLNKPLSFIPKQIYSLEDASSLCAELESLGENNSSEMKDNYQRLCQVTNEAQQEHRCLLCFVRSYNSFCLITASYEASDANSSCSISQIKILNPIIWPLMSGLKKLGNKITRFSISKALTLFMDHCSNRDPCPNSKLLRNICQLLHADYSICPDILDPAAALPNEVVDHFKLTCKEDTVHYSILTLLKKHSFRDKHITENATKKSNASPTGGVDEKMNPIFARKGAMSCISFMCEHFKVRLFIVLPQLWSIVSEPFMSSNKSDHAPETNGALTETNSSDIEILKKKVLSLLVLEAMTENISEDLAREKIFPLLPEMLKLIWNRYTAVRYICCRCLAVFAKRFVSEVACLFIEQFLPSIDATEDLCKRMGTIEMIANMIDCLQTLILPYTVILVVPLLGRMSDHNIQARLAATQCFATLIQYLPVESSIPDPPDMTLSLIDKRKFDRRFLEQLLDSNSIEEYPVPVPINAKLRKYQQDGVKWMAFLNRYKLHGILCDDMGLGKTLQSICILASDHYYLTSEHKSDARLPSLVICPPTLTGHWMDEISKFCSEEYLDPLQYAGQPAERSKLQGQLRHHNLVIASYEVVRNDFMFFKDVLWNYCILDEGQMIRNGKSKLSVCVKSLKSNHRLILTGTPIQNSVLELWSLFDFLMPGFLGSEQEFNSRYSKPILASRDAKSTSREQEEGVMAMEALHRQVLPFMLRRMKEDVLQDLPPKIIQDYYCSLSALQARLYEDFAKTRAKKEVDSSITHADKDQNATSRAKHTSHVFQALQYLQKVCNHPALVLTPCHPEYGEIIQQLSKERSSLHDINHSSKLVALKQLLLDCGIGDTEDREVEDIVNQHRALIFCQHKSMLDIVEHDLLRKYMKTVTFLRLDGSVAASNRHGIVSKFNNDPSIDLLLLTTKVGGLGLNLTGADTVIFIEHDWNPTVDLQAMDRAHRIGQKRVVNVYRLITRATLEEKILGLQQFKMNIANTILSTDNSSLHSMGTNQLLDLFTINKSEAEKKNASGKNSGKGLRVLMDEVGELWDQNQYDNEYNLDTFMQSLQR